MHKRKLNSALIVPLIIFLSITIIYALPLLKNITYWGQMDWDQFTFWNAVPRETILKYRQFPLWNPYSNGGNVLLALPHSSFLSPFFILILLFGPIISLKLQWAISIFIGMVGMFFISGYFGMGKISRYLPSVLFMLSSLFTLHLTEGHAEWTAMAFLPWFFLFTLKAHTSKKYFFLAIFSLSLMILGGSVYVFNIIVVFIIIYFILISLKEIKTKYILSLSGIFLCTFLLCSIKLIPMLEFLKEYPRKVESSEKVDIYLIPTMLLSRKQNFVYHNTKWTNPQERVKVNEREFEYGWHEYGAYIGIMPLLLAIIGTIFYFKDYWPLFITGILSLWISLGGGAIYNLWNLIHNLPIYDSLHVPSRFILGFIFCVSVFSGLGLSRFEVLTRKKYCKFLVAIIVGFIFFDLYLVNCPLLRSTFTIEPTRITRYREFRQRFRDFNIFPARSRSSLYPIFLSNSGILNAYEVINVNKGDILIISDPNYRGEVYLVQDKGSAALNYFSPNKIIVDVNAKNLDILVLNQNYFNGWRAKSDIGKKAVQSFKGLVATVVNSEDKKVTFYYLPFSFIIGLLMTGGTIIAAILFWQGELLNIFKVLKSKNA